MKKLLLTLLCLLPLMADTDTFEKEMAIVQANHSNVLVFERFKYSIEHQNLTKMAVQSANVVCKDKDNVILLYIYKDGVFSFSSEDCK